MMGWFGWLLCANVFFAALGLSLVASIEKQRDAPPVLTRLLTAFSLSLSFLAGFLCGQLLKGDV